MSLFPVKGYKFSIITEPEAVQKPPHLIRGQVVGQSDHKSLNLTPPRFRPLSITSRLLNPLPFVQLLPPLLTPSLTLQILLRCPTLPETSEPSPLSPPAFSLVCPVTQGPGALNQFHGGRGSLPLFLSRSRSSH